MARPTVIDKVVLAKLEYAFKRGYSNAEASLHAEIDEATLYRYFNDNKEFSEKAKTLKSHMLLKAKEIVNDKIESKDLDTAKWYLERKNKEEFSPRTDIKHENDKDNPINPTYAIVSERILAILEAGREIQNPTK